MSELHKFIFDGKPVRGMLVCLTDAWQDILARRADNRDTGPYPQPVTELLGEMAAAGVLMQGNIKFNGALILQIFGDGPVKVAVAEVQPDFALRVTATMTQPVAEGAGLPDMVNPGGQGRCAITLDPKDRLPGQQPYQGVVSLVNVQGQSLEQLNEVLEQYMRQSEQLDTVLVLAANDKVAAGLLIQKLPVEGEGNLAGTAAPSAQTQDMEQAFEHIAILSRSLKREELLELDPMTILHRLFWEEPVRLLESFKDDTAPRFACTCSRERVSRMIQSLGQDEAQSILDEQDKIDVGCDFCGAHYLFDAVDVAQAFNEAATSAALGSASLH